ncbi:hypothetical protein [Nitrosomonas sp. Nm51]|uniref:hypothetical protein n=1 Tax=Nitrosomonas sp. Nm51 TaxID=133720 RepID=UPI00115F8A00|nr:hypothetical protein [Nitrosomonas sp. Nm51]
MRTPLLYLARNRSCTLTGLSGLGAQSTVFAKYFDSAAEGSLTKSIRRAILEQTQITVPPLETQHKILGLHKAILQEKKLYTALIRNADKLMHAFASDLTAGKTLQTVNTHRELQP